MLSPVQAMARTCTRDTVVRDTEIKAGERVVLLFGAGNRDPDAFDDPDTIRFDRTKNRHLAKPRIRGPIGHGRRAEPSQVASDCFGSCKKERDDAALEVFH